MPKIKRVSGQPSLVKRRIELVKERVDCVQVANEALQERGEDALRRSGKRWRGTCPLCGNGGRSDAFSCAFKTFWCFACGEGGDVVKLVQKLYGYSAGMSAAWLGERYGVELPARPDSWYSKVDRQARTRDLLSQKRKDIMRRRLFKYFILPELEKIANPEEREEEILAAWEDFRHFPVRDMPHG